MSSYTLTISPDDSTAPSTTVHVDYTPAGPRITGLHLDAGTDGGLTPDALPVIDLNTLLQALAPIAQPAPTITAPPAPAAAITTTATTGAPATAPVLAPMPTTAAPAPDSTEIAAAPRRGRRTVARTSTRGRSGATGTAPAPTTTRGTVGAPHARRSTGSADAAAPTSAAPQGQRPYRRVPHDLAEVLGQVGSVTGVADHYQVPRHTAQGWVSGARRKGQIPAA